MSTQSHIAAIILAAGESSRLGQPKQLIQFQSKTLVRRVVDAASEAGCQPILVVLGSETDTELVQGISSELKNTGATIIGNPNWKGGIGTSIRTGVQHLIEIAPGVEATVLLACDQPFVDRAVIEGLITLHHETRKPIVAARYADTLGVPALFDRSRCRIYSDWMISLGQNRSFFQIAIKLQNSHFPRARSTSTRRKIANGSV